MTMTRPQIGTMVQWFTGALRSDTPQPAMVVAMAGVSNVKLLTWDTNGGTKMRDTCCHMDDDDLATHPEWKRQFGGWDYIPCVTESQSAPAVEPTPAQETTKRTHNKNTGQQALV
jgi:hypothetical protein